MLLRSVILTVAFFSLLHIASSHAATDHWYEVEVIVFANTQVTAEDDLMSRQPTLPNLNNSVSLLPLQKPRVPFQIMPIEQRKFTGIYRQLEYASTYQPLLYTAWQQPALEGRWAHKVHLHVPATKQDTSPTAGHEEVASILSGFIKIRSGYYLHATVDMAFFNRAIADSTGDLRYHFVRLQETRKIKLKEKHYFDHPLFGVILEVRRAQSDANK